MFNEISSEGEILKNELKSYGHIFDKNVSRELNNNESIENQLCGHREKFMD